MKLVSEENGFCFPIACDNCGGVFEGEDKIANLYTDKMEKLCSLCPQCAQLATKDLNSFRKMHLYKLAKELLFNGVNGKESYTDNEQMTGLIFSEEVEVEKTDG